MNNFVKELYFEARRHGYVAQHALHVAWSVFDFAFAESEGNVRLEAVPEEESYWDVYGEPDDDDERRRTEELIVHWGCVCVQSSYLGPDGDWHVADSVGMCVYANPLCWRENWYVPDLMRAAVKQHRRAWYEAGASV